MSGSHLGPQDQPMCPCNKAVSSSTPCTEAIDDKDEFSLTRNGSPFKGSTDEFVVLAMRADPEPMDTGWHWQTEGSVVEANSHTVETAIADRLALKRRISLELGLAPVGQGLNVSWLRFQALPKAP